MIEVSKAFRLSVDLRLPEIEVETAKEFSEVSKAFRLSVDLRLQKPISKTPSGTGVSKAFRLSVDLRLASIAWSSIQLWTGLKSLSAFRRFATIPGNDRSLSGTARVSKAFRLSVDLRRG